MESFLSAEWQSENNMSSSIPFLFFRLTKVNWKIFLSLRSLKRVQMQGVQIPAFEQGLHIETKWWSATKQKGKAYWVSINLFQIVIWILNLQVESWFFWQARVLVSRTRTCRGVSLSTWHQVTSRKFGFHSVTGSGHGGQVPEETELKVRILKTFGGEFQVMDSGLWSEFAVFGTGLLAPPNFGVFHRIRWISENPPISFRISLI